MKEMKRILCGIMASLMLVDAAAGISCTAYAEEDGAEEQEPILQMESVLGWDSTDVSSAAELQTETALPNGQSAESASEPELDVSSLHVEYDARLGGAATLTYRVTGESRITYCCASVIAVTNGGVRDDGLGLWHTSVTGFDVVAKNGFTLAFYGTYQVQRIDVHDEYGYGVSYYNSKCLTYNGETPAVDMSAVDFVLPAPVDDTTAPVIDLSSIQLEKNVIEPDEANALYVGVEDDSAIVDLRARFMRETDQLSCETSGFSKSDDGRYVLPVTEDIIGVWQLFSISATDASGNTTEYINSSHPEYSYIYGTENLRDLSNIAFEVKRDSFATPAIDFSSFGVDKEISYNNEVVVASFEAENPDSVKEIYVLYRATTEAGQERETYRFGYSKDLNRFRGWCWPSYFGTYEAEMIELLDYSGEWQRIYNSALAYSWTLPEDTVFADLSALNFSSVDAQIYTMEDLKTALAAAKDGDKLQIAASENFVITEDITIPKGVYLNIRSGSGSFKIAKGATLTTESRFNCYVPMTVEGTWLEGIDTTESSAQSSVRELTVATGGTVESDSLSVDGALVVGENAMLSTRDLHISQKITVNGTWKNRGNPYCYDGLTIGETGAVTSDSWLRSDGLVTVAGVWTHNAGADLNGGLTITPTGSINGVGGRIDVDGAFINEGRLAAGVRVYCTHTVTSQKELENILKGTFRSWDTIQIVGDGQEFTLTESITIPDEVYLNIQSSVGKFVVAEKTILTAGSGFYCYAPMEVKGTFVSVIEGSRATFGSMSVSETGRVTVNCSAYADSIRVGGAFENNNEIWINGDLLISAAGRMTNNGTITVCGTYANDGMAEQGEKGSIYRHYSVSTVEDLMAITATAKKGDTIVLKSDGEEFIVDRDITIPDGVSLQFYGTLVIAKGATLTTSDIDAPKMMVNGTWKNYGNPNLYQGLSIGESGVVENNGYLQIGDQYENHGKLTNGSDGSARLSLRAKDETELLAALAYDDPGEKEIDFRVSGEMTITEDVQIPTNTELNIYDYTGEGKATLTIGEGTTLTNFGGFNCYVPIVVAGTLTSVGGMRMEKGLTITAAGTVDTTSGWFNLNGPLVNNGTLAQGSNVNQTIEVHSVDELQSALAAMVPRGEVKLKSESEVILSSDMVIPKGITVEVYESVQNLRIAASSKLVIDAEATLRSYAPLIVEGTVDNYGAIGARKGLSVTGKIENYNYIRTEGDLVGAENIHDHEAGNQSVRQQYAVDSEESLTNILNTIPVSNRDWIRLMAAEGFALTKDITIPAGVYLEIQTGEFKVNGGATLTTHDNLIVNGDMRVDGCWENLHNKTGYSEVSGILTVNGTVENSGHIELHRYTDAFAQKKIQNSSSGTLGIGIQVLDTEELRRILNDVEGNWSMSVTWCGGDDLELDRDLTIPDGIRFYIDDAKIIIPEGVTLTIEADARVSANDVDVQGALLNNGYFDSNALTISGKLVNNSSLQSDSITVPGELVNTSRLTCHNDITVSGQLANSNSVSFSALRIKDGGYVSNEGVLMGEIENRGRLEQTERTGGNGVFYVSLMHTSCDWKDVFANVRSGDTINGGSWSADAYIEITEDTTLPENVSVNGLNFRVKEGVTFTTSGSGFKPYVMQVDGTWINNGNVELDRLMVNGDVQNNGSITTREAVTGTGIVTGNVAICADWAKYCSAYKLQEALCNAKSGDTVSCYVDYGNGGSLILNESITVPAGVTLKFDGETEKVYLAAGHTLTIDGTLILQQPLYAAGSLVINGEVVLPSAYEVDIGHVQYLELVSGSISAIEDGSCELNGSIRVGKTDYTGQTIEDPWSLITGVATDEWALRDVDDYWYLTKKPTEGRAEVFCSLPVTGCKLRLVDESGNARELTLSGSYALINDITSGEYTLEVSKPGYVTHTYKVDTTALPDVLDAELVRKGDVNGAATAGGAVDVTDMACLYTLLSTGHYSGQITDSEYQNAVADVNGDGRIDILDYQRLYTAVQGTAPLT